MKPIKFEEANSNLTKPDGMEKECGDLWVYTDGLHCVSCWKMNWKQRIKALLLGKVWLCVLSDGSQPPVWLDCCKTVFSDIKE